MSKINEGMDLNDPQKKLVFAINQRNEEKYGPYHEECGLFQEFCRCYNTKDQELKKKESKKYDKEKEGVANKIISELQGLIYDFKPENKSDFLNYIGNIICQFDADIAIKVMEDFGEEGKEEATRIKVIYGY